MLRSDIQAVVFDFDNTLYENPPTKDDIFAEAHARAAIHLGAKMDLATAISTARQSYSQHKSEMFLFCRDHGLDEKQLYLHTHSIGAALMAQALQPHQGIKAAFNALSQGRELVLLTHGSEHWARTLMDHLQLSEHVDHKRILALDHPVVNYQRKDVGPGVFNDVAGMIGIPSCHMAMVEDTAINLIHASAVGMQTVLVHWGRPVDPKPAYVDLQMHSIVELAP